MRKDKKFAIILPIILLCSVFLGNFSVSAAFTPNFTIHSEAVYMVNTDTDIEIVSKNADKRLFPASTTKIMTCLVALENIKDFNAYVYTPYTAFNEFNADNPNFYGVSNAAIEPLQTNVTYRDLLYSLMVCSACESANILAYNVGGESIENFVTMMNEKAKEIGCKNTNFTNPHGLFDENNYTTAYDLYLITKYAMDNYPRFMEICDTYSYDMPANSANPDGYTVYQTNPMISTGSPYYFEGAHAIKTGSLDRYYYKKSDGSFDRENVDYGSRALVTTAEREGFHYILVTLNAPYCNPDGTATDTILSFTDHINLYSWAFNEFEYTLVINKNEQIMQMDVEKGKDADTVGLVVTEDFWTLLPKSLNATTIQRICETDEDKLVAPVEKGAEMGTLKLLLNGEPLINMTLVTENAVELDMTEFYKEKINGVFDTWQFKAVVVLVGVLIVMCVVTSIIRKNHKKRVAEMNRRRKISMVSPNKGRTKNRNIRR